MARKPAVRLIPMALVLLALTLRELGLWDLSAYIHDDRIERSLEKSDRRTKKLTPEELAHRKNWKTLVLPDRKDTKVYYTELRNDPWGRWIPLIKFGKTEISRPFFVVRNDLRLLSGAVKWEIDETVAGFSSAREYASNATPADPKEFLECIQQELAAAKPAG